MFTFFIKESKQFSGFQIDDFLVKMCFRHQDNMLLMLIFQIPDYRHLFQQLGSLQVKLTMISHLQMKILLVSFLLSVPV